MCERKIYTYVCQGKESGIERICVCGRTRKSEREREKKIKNYIKEREKSEIERMCGYMYVSAPEREREEEESERVYLCARMALRE